MNQRLAYRRRLDPGNGSYPPEYRRQGDGCQSPINQTLQPSLLCIYEQVSFIQPRKPRSPEQSTPH